MSHKAGGGINSRQHKSVGVRTGTPRPRGQNPRWTSQIGSSLGNHATNRTGMMPTSKVVEKRHTGEEGRGARLGNEVALNVGRGGPGKGRQIYSTGSQQQHGSANSGNPRPVGPDIFTEFPGKGR
jgi:hypothetical protein